MEEKTLCELVRRNESIFNGGETVISEYVSISIKENINKIDAYLNSKHVSGSTDAQGREKPFFNIVSAARNIWMRATDIDRRNIKIRPTKSRDIFVDFLATIHLQNWMRKVNYGVYLNDWGRVLAGYGSALSKFIETDGVLYPMVIPWNRLIVDSVDVNNDVIIEVLELTPAQLRKRNYNKEQVEALIAAATTRKTVQGAQKDVKSGYIRVYEVHGEMPMSYLKEDGDPTEYVQQMHVISFVGAQKVGSYDDFTLYKGKEAKNPYHIAHLIKEDGRAIAIGAVENLFEAQWMLNVNKKQIQDQLELASKLIFQTSDPNYVGQNALNDVDNGDIMIHAPNQPLTQMQNNSHDISSLQNYGTEWKNLGMEINGISESMMGNTAPSGTAWRQVEAVLQESHSLFELMTENKGLAIEETMREFVIPHLKTKMDSTDEIVSALEAYDIDRIDKKYVPVEATRRLAKKLIAQIGETGEIPLVTEDMQLGEEMKVKEQLSLQGTSRYFKPSDLDGVKWSDLFKDFEWEVEVDVTGEQSNTQADMATLTTVFQTIASNPQVLENPKIATVFNRIIAKTGAISPMELQDIGQMEQPQAAPQQLPAQPMQNAA